ncbi:MAG: RHS repeat domain-containing protein [Pyrinomonadaceae bacterium]
MTATDEFNQITRTEYNDPLLRPTRVFGENFTAPEAQTIYGDTPGNLFVKVRKQIDETNWDEATTFIDGLGRAVKTQAKDSQGDVFVETKYDNLGRVAATSNPYRNGDTLHWSKPRYDELNRVVETYAPEAGNPLDPNIHGASLGVTSFGISTVPNFVGTVVTTTDASLRKGRSITNALGQLIRIDEPTGITASADADLGALDNPIQPTFYTYSPQGKMVHVQQGKTGEPAIQHRYFLYDSLGRHIRVRQPEQDINASLNLSDPVTGNSQWTAAFSYDVLGNVLTATDAKGTVIHNEYDRASRVKTRTYSGEPAGVVTPAVSFFYDGKGLAAPQTPNFAKGKLTRVFSTVSETKNTVFDNFGRLKETQQITDGNTYTSKYAYNFSGALIEEEYPSGRKVINEFESDGDLMRVTSAKNAASVFAPCVSNFSYTASGGISQMRLGNGRWETAKFNTRLQVTELGLGASSVDAGTWKVNYDYGELNTDGSVDTSKNTGNIAKQTLSFNGLTNPLVQAYRYDSLYRITEAKETANGQQNWIQNWGYDRYGNRASFTQNIAGNTTAVNPTVDVNTNRFTAGQGFVYDINGNLIRDAEGRQFTFNADNKQVQVKDVNNSIIGTYYYDGEGKRVKKVTNSETTIFVYSSGKLVAEYSTQLAVQPSTNYTTTDHLGSPRIITDALGQVKSRRDFHPFGEDIFNGVGNRTAALKYGSTQDDIRQKFTGYQKDSETNLDYAEARMYENRFGRFTAVDPLLASGKSANPQTFNRYVYVGANPIKRTDPKGLIWLEDKDGAIFWVGDKHYKKNKSQYKDYTVRNAGFILKLKNAGEGFEQYEGKYIMLGKKFEVSEVEMVDYDGNPIDSPTRPANAMSAGQSDDSGVLRLALEWFTGTGPEERQFGPDSYMNQGVQSSPMLQIHRDRFAANGGGSYDSEIYSNATGEYPPRYGMPSAPDGPWTSGTNMPRQFVGSFNVKITELRGANGNYTGNALFEVRNPTHFNSFAYGSVAQGAGITVPTWNRSGERDPSSITRNYFMSRTNQTFWWVETGVVKR